MFNELRSEPLIDEQTGKHQERGTGHIEQRAHGVGENVIEPRPPVIRPHVAEGGHDAVGNDGLKIVRHAREGIESDRPLDIGRVDIDEVVGAAPRDVVQRGLGEIAVGIEKSYALAGREILADEIEQQRALAGAGLTDDVEMPTSLLGIEHDIATRRKGANANLLAECCHSRNGAGVPCAPQFGRWRRAASCFPQGAPGLHGVVVIVRRDLTAEPPAHNRLVFGHDLFGMWPHRLYRLAFKNISPTCGDREQRIATFIPLGGT